MPQAYPLRAATSLAVACCLVLALVQVLDTQKKYARVLLQAARTQQLGEDKDWDVKTWSAKHKEAVGNAKLDKATLKNIWHSKKEAWKGIDDILPTGGRYGYEENHAMTADQAHLTDYIKYAKKNIAAMEKALPQKVPAGLEKEVAEAKKLLSTEDAKLNSLSLQAFGHHSKKAPAQMLNQVEGRVYQDDALYGEGILGDIKSQGHKKARWSAHNAKSDMKKYFSKLATVANQEAVAHDKSTYHVTNQKMSRYFDWLDGQEEAKKIVHDNILKQDGYFKNHPSEHRNMAKFIADSYSAGHQEAPKLAAAPTDNKFVRDAWVSKYGEPKTEEQKLALQKFEKKASNVLEKAETSIVQSLV